MFKDDRSTIMINNNYGVLKYGVVSIVFLLRFSINITK